MCLLLAPPSRAVINFSARSAELDCIMHSTHVHHQNCTCWNGCKENELLRIQNPSSSELILLANVYQRWVVREVLFLQFSFITEALWGYRLCFSSLLIKPCQSCAAATPTTQLCKPSPPPAGSRPGPGVWGQRRPGAAAPRRPRTHRQQLTEENRQTGKQGYRETKRNDCAPAGAARAEQSGIPNNEKCYRGRWVIRPCDENWAVKVRFQGLGK